MPAPNKVVVIIFENHAYGQIVGSSYAPYINSLINDSMTALFTQSFALSRPSQPNYLQLFSGSTQGVTTNNVPTGIPFTTPNLYSELAAASKTFAAYSQSLPYTGYIGSASGGYARKHAPWVNWQGIGPNGIPSTLHMPFTSFPTNYNNLPTVSFVVPDQDNDMHNGSDPARISAADTWFQNNMNGYVQWARTNNSLLIFHFDEDDFTESNRVLTFFYGPMVAKGSYSNYIDHYSILRTIEDIFGLTHAGSAATATPIDYCWKCPTQSIITAGGPVSFCAGNTVTLTAPAGTEYLWSNGATTQSIVAGTTGNYNCRMRQASGCVSVTNTITVTVNPIPTITGFNPAGGIQGTLVTLTGDNFSNATQVFLNGANVTFSIVNTNRIQFNVPAGASTGNIQVYNNCGPSQPIGQFIVYPSSVTLNLKMLIEGYYKGNGIMRPVISANVCDTLIAELRQKTYPYSVNYTAKAAVDTNGNAVFSFSGYASGTEYYISVSGKNFLKTWSAVPVLFSNSVSYDFTTSASKAYNGVQKNLGNFFAFYSGDINQDGNINTTDFYLLKSAILTFATIPVSCDLNGDSFIESADFSLFEGNNVPMATGRP